MDERVESFASAAGGLEALLKCAGVAFGFRILFSRAIHRRVGKADDDASNRPQHARRFGRAHPALILSQRDVQAVVQSALHHPIAAFERKHSPGLKCLQTQAADQMDDFPAPFNLLVPALLALDSRFQSGH